MIVPEIMRVGFKYIAKTNSGYTAIIILRLIPSPLVIRQGGYNTTQRTVTFPVSFKHPVFAVAGNAVIGHDEAVQTWNYTKTSFYLHEAYQEGAHWVAFGLG